MKTVVKRMLTAILCASMTLAGLAACSAGTPEAASPEAEAPSDQSEGVVSAPHSNPSQDGDTRSVTDAAGNTVEVPADLSRIAVTPLPWSSVINAIDGTSEHMVSINPGAMKAYTGSFVEKLDSAYANLDTGSIGSDFSINMEEMLKREIQAVVIWDYQTDEAQQLTELGIVPVMIKNETIADLQASFTAIGQLLGKEERAQEFNDLYMEAYDYLQPFAGQVEAAEKPKVLYLRNTELKLQMTTRAFDAQLTASPTK